MYIKSDGIKLYQQLLYYYNNNMQQNIYTYIRKYHLSVIYICMLMYIKKYRKGKKMLTILYVTINQNYYKSNYIFSFYIYHT